PDASVARFPAERKGAPALARIPRCKARSLRLRNSIASRELHFLPGRTSFDRSQVAEQVASKESVPRRRIQATPPAYLFCPGILVLRADQPLHPHKPSG